METIDPELYATGGFTKSGLLDPKFHRWLLDAFDIRLQEDYDAETLVSGERVEEMLEQARTFLAAAREFLGGGPSSSSPAS